MTKLPARDGQVIANFTQTLSLGQLANKHGDILIPGRETIGMTFCLIVMNQP
jgi:hypothetical protein